MDSARVLLAAINIQLSLLVVIEALSFKDNRFLSWVVIAVALGTALGGLLYVR